MFWVSVPNVAKIYSLKISYMSARTPAGQQHPVLSRPNLEDLAGMLRSRKDRSGDHSKPEKNASTVRKKSASHRTDSAAHADEAKKLRTQVDCLLEKRMAQECCSGAKCDDNIKSGKKATTGGNYFLTADVSNVLRAINLNMEGSLGRRHPKEMTEDDIDQLFQPSHSKNKKGDKENDCHFNFRQERQPRKDLLMSKASLNSAKKNDLQAEPFNEFEVMRLETMKVAGVRELAQMPEEEPKIERILGKTNKDLAESIRFLQIDDEPIDKLLNGLRGQGLKKIEDNQTIDKTTKFKAEFLVGKQIGEGAYASVRVAVFKPTSQKIAIKIYEKKKIRQLPRKKSIRRQIKILQQVDHPNIVKILDVIETNNHVNIIMEYISGIPLSTYLKGQPNSKIAERDARRIFQPLVDSVRYLHSMKVSHRDIKLENILLDGRLSPKLIDFGFATCILDKVKIFCGTPSYMAPEIVLKTEYRGEPADVWAMGVLLYVMLTGIFPFKGQTDKQLYKKIVMSDYPKIQGVSKQGVTLIAKMLTVEADARITADEVLLDQWITGVPRRQRSDTSKMIKRISQSTPKHSYEILDSLIKRTSEKPSVSREKVLCFTQKETLREQLRMANANLAIFNPSPQKNSMPNTCTNRDSARIKLEYDQKIVLRTVEQANKKSEQKLTNKRYF